MKRPDIYEESEVLYFSPIPSIFAILQYFTHFGEQNMAELAEQLTVNIKK